MIDKRDVIAFFDQRAAAWDAEMIRHEPVIQAILDNAGVGDGTRVLDVACGTGVLFPDYLARGASVTGIDISPEMARIAAAKFTGEPRVQVLCGDVEKQCSRRHSTWSWCTMPSPTSPIRRGSWPVWHRWCGPADGCPWPTA